MAAAVLGNLRIRLDLDTASFSKKMKSVGKRMNRIGKDLSFNLTAPIALFGTATLQAAGNFEAGMNRVQAVSGATGEQLKQMRDQAKELGATTQFSASQAADAMGFLAMAGFETNEIMGAMPGTLQLAAASQIDLGTAADAVSNILSGYGLKVEELGRVNDVLVKVTASANTDMLQLAQAMKFAGPVAAAAGVQFEEAAAAIGLMGNAGIQSTMAGTSLRGAISRILDPTKKMKDTMAELGLKFTDAQGRILPLSQIIRQLAPHANDAGLFMKLFGQRAGPAMAALVSQGEEALMSLTQNLLNAGGTAEKIANAQMKGFLGAMKELISAVEGFMITVSDSGLLQFFTDLIKSITKTVQGLSETNPELLKIGTIILGVAAVLGPFLILMGSLANAVSIMAPLLIAMSTPLLTVAAGIGTLIAAWNLGKKLGEWRVGGKSINEWVLDAFEFVLGGGLLSKLKSGFNRIFDFIKNIGAKIAARISRVISSFKRLFSFSATAAAVPEPTAAAAESGANVNSTEINTTNNISINQTSGDPLETAQVISEELKLVTDRSGG